MIRTGLLALMGCVAGVGLTAGLLAATAEYLRQQTAPRVFQMDHGVVYLSVVLGAGFGAVTGAMIGLAGCVTRSRQTSPAPEDAKQRTPSESGMRES